MGVMAREKDVKKEKQGSEKWHKAQAKLNLAKNAMEMGTKKVERLQTEKERSKMVSETQTKHAQKRKLKAKAAAKIAKERLKKDKKKPSMKKVSGAGVKAAKAGAKDAEGL